MTSPAFCPYLGLAGDRTLIRTDPDQLHRCHAQTPPGAPDDDFQRAFCLTDAHISCPFYAQPKRQAAAVVAEPKAAQPSVAPMMSPSWRRYAPWAALAIVLAVIAWIYASDLHGGTLQDPAASTAEPSVTVVASVAASATPASAVAAVASPQPVALSTATSEPGGRLLVLTPEPGGAGWWASEQTRGNNLGDSYLYAGRTNGQAFVSAARFGLHEAPRGAPLRQAFLQLTGLNADRFDPAAGGSWTVQLLAADAVPDYVRAGFQTLFNAPASVTLFPSLSSADLGSGVVNSLQFDASALAWLEDQIQGGASAVIMRILGPSDDSTLFAWDSGAGPATIGEGPRLVLNLGPSAATPLPPPSAAIVIGTLTPTPANVLTAAAEAWTATAIVRTIGTYTPLPYRVVTATPVPANLATAQALARLRGLQPIVQHTATPANPATATQQALVATAIAFMTGTPTPPPPDAVTPIIVTPTPVPGNIVTAAARFFAATAQVAAEGTPTPWAYNVVVATPSPLPLVITFTPPAANAATAVARSAYATAVALIIGTFTPLPPNVATPTPP